MQAMWNNEQVRADRQFSKLQPSARADWCRDGPFELHRKNPCLLILKTPVAGKT